MPGTHSPPKMAALSMTKITVQLGSLLLLEKKELIGDSRHDLSMLSRVDLDSVPQNLSCPSAVTPCPGGWGLGKLPRWFQYAAKTESHGLSREIVTEGRGTLEIPGVSGDKGPTGGEPTGPVQGHGKPHPSVKGQVSPNMCWVGGAWQGQRAEGGLGGRSCGWAPRGC